ncbi:hypothetical protein YPPY59_2482, partial [Yersinia pestis PY-59]
MDVFTASL